MNKEEESIKTMMKLKKIFDKHNIEYWLDEGTLLGAIREKKFIEWDHDIDFGVWSETIPKITLLFNELRDSEIEICFFDWKKHIKFLSNGYEIDINPYHLKGKKATRTWYAHNKLGDILDYIIWMLHIGDVKYRKSEAPSFIKKSILGFRKLAPKCMSKKIIKILLKIYEKMGCKLIHIAIPSHFFTEFTTIEFYDSEFKGPKETEKYLEYRYGKDWRIPKRDYVYTTDDHSIVKE
jgi:phosphorylcholine metabolism protein LicD